MKVSELGEFGLIERLTAVLASENDGVAPERLLVGIGDDAAVWRNDTSATVATTDTLVADVHFLPGRTPWRDVGWKSIAVNVSDIAAMGCWPNFALVTLGLPADVESDDMEELYAGVGEAAKNYGVTVTGGDVVRAPVVFVSVVLTGRAELDEAKRHEIYVEMQQIVRDEGGVVVPLFANYVNAMSTKVQHDPAMSGSWDLDGLKGMERWWFA